MIRINLEMLRLDFQPPECLIEEDRAREDATARRRPTSGAIIVRFDGESYFVQDGFHRIEAARR